MMSTKVVVVLLGLCVVLATAKPAADTSLDFFTAMGQRTAAANKALAALPAACTRDSARSILEGKIEAFGSFASCGVFAIIKDIAYILIDFADFGSASWSDGVILVDSIKACIKERTFLEKLDCLDNTLFSSGNTFETINEAIRTFVEQLLTIIPDIESRIRTCNLESAQQYILLLDGLVEKAQTC